MTYLLSVHLGLLAQEPDLHKFFTFDPVLSAWLLAPGLLLVAIATFYLYRAQRQIASRGLVWVLTTIRVLLILLVFGLLLRPLWVWKQTTTSPQTVWIVADQSLSMAQVDAQSTPLERLRWASALGELPASVHPGPLPRLMAELTALQGDLQNLQQRTANSSLPSETRSEQDVFIKDLTQWRQRLAATIQSIGRASRLESGDGPALVRTLNEMLRTVDRGIQDASGRNDPAQAANDLPWARIETILDTSVARLRPIANRADEEFLKVHSTEPQLSGVLQSVGQKRRADLASSALVAGNSEDSLMNFLERQHTRLLGFGSTASVLPQSPGKLTEGIKTALKPSSSATNLGRALQLVNEQIEDGELASVLIISDGRSNTGVDPTEPAQRLAARGVRVFALAVGSREPAADAAVESVDAPDWIYKDDTVRASALIRLDKLAGKSVKVELLRGQTVVQSQSIAPTSAQMTQLLTFQDRPPEPGVFSYQVRILPVSGEAVADNNAQQFRISVKKEKLQVLIVEDQPRWEYRYLANFLKRDNRVHLQTVLLEPARVEKIAPPAPIKASPLNDRDEAQLLPTSGEEWSAFDMIVIGDVPPEFLTADAQKNIAAAVHNRGTTLVLIAGPLNFPQRYAALPLAELLPVQVASNWSSAELSAQLTRGFRPAIAPEGISSVLSQFALDEQMNTQLWAGLPEFYWHSEQTQAKAGASVLWQIPSSQPGSQETLTAAKQRALLATMPAGLGRVIYLASDSTWRLREVRGENVHERFWGQVVGWAAGNDMPAGGRFVRFGADKPSYGAGESIHLSARLLKNDFTPLTNEKAKAVAKIGSAKVEAVLVETPQTPGLYHATLANVPAGACEISLEGANVQRLLDGDPSATQKTLRVDVQSQATVEHRNVNADRAALARVAREGNGFSLDAEYADVMASHLPQSSRKVTTTQQFGVFADPQAVYTRIAHWSFLAIFVVLITVEWVLRKVGGLV